VQETLRQWKIGGLSFSKMNILNIISPTDLNFFKKLLMKTITMFGFTYFSIAVTTQNWIMVTPALLASGLYAFTELTKYYKLPTDPKIKKGTYAFLI